MARYYVYDPEFGMIFLNKEGSARKKAKELLDKVNRHKLFPTGVSWGIVKEEVRLVAIDEYDLVEVK